MTLADQLASSLERNDEVPNVELAQKLAKQSELSQDILELLSIVKNAQKAQKHDAIKVLYELAALRPEAFGDKFGFALDLLATKDNRILWGAMALLASICKYNLDQTISHLPQILEAADRGSVIAKDNAIAILLQLAADEKHRAETMSVLCERLKTAAPNQLPMYAENAAKALKNCENAELVHVLFERLDEMPTPAKRKRLEEAIAKLSLPPKPLALA